jgi:integrase
MAPATVNWYLTLTSSIFKFGVREGYVATNPFRGLRVADLVRPQDKRRSFTPSELDQFFHGRLYPSGPITKGVQWIPLICLFQGLRLGEACALAADDVAEVTGIPVLHVRSSIVRRLKTPSAQRTVPVHPKLIELGLIVHAERQRQGGATMLLDLKAGHRGDFSPVSKALNGAIRSAGIKDPRVVVHSPSPYVRRWRQGGERPTRSA